MMNRIQRAKPPQKIAPPFYILTARSAADLLRGARTVIHRNRDDITAISTVVVAIFTGTLWWVTWGMVCIAKDQQADVKESLRISGDAVEAAKRSAEAADLSAKASIEVELPSLHVESVKTTFAWRDDIKAWLNLFIPEITIKNYGRTPAFVTEVSVAVHVGITMPCEPIYPPPQNICLDLQSRRGRTTRSQHIVITGWTSFLTIK